MDVDERAAALAALGEPSRLRIVDALARSDRTFQELAAAAGLPGNAAAHHLRVLEDAGLIRRHPSEGDRRRRYLSLDLDRLSGILPVALSVPASVLFVCSHNSARSQFAAGLWRRRTGSSADSAGSTPALAVHPTAVAVARDFGVDLSGTVPKGYEGVAVAPDLIVSVCDRAREATIPFGVTSIHWSIPDPVLAGSRRAFESAFAEIARRIDQMTTASQA